MKRINFKSIIQPPEKLKDITITGKNSEKFRKEAINKEYVFVYLKLIISVICVICGIVLIVKGFNSEVVLKNRIIGEVKGPLGIILIVGGIITILITKPKIMLKQ